MASKLLNRDPNYWILTSKLLKTATTFWPSTKPRQGKRAATGQRRPLLQVETSRLKLSDRRQKRNGTLLHAAGRRSWALYTQERTSCLWFFAFFIVRKVIEQRRPLLQIEMGRLMLLDCRWKHSVQRSKCSSFRTAALYTRQTNICLSRAVPDTATTLLHLQSPGCYTLWATLYWIRSIHTTCRLPHKANDTQWNIHKIQASEHARSKHKQAHNATLQSSGFPNGECSQQNDPVEYNHHIPNQTTL